LLITFHWFFINPKRTPVKIDPFTTRLGTNFTHVKTSKTAKDIE
jgi:hypothetical protein